jgi:hypothetical protein
MNQLQEIFTAWGIAFNPNNEQAEKAAKRIEVCNSCDKKVTNLGIHRCSVCGCALKGKIFSPIQGACPEGKWDEVDKKFYEMKKFTYKVTKKDTIFIQIASYRDPELNNTIKSLLTNSKYPDNLRICIAHQFGEEEWDNLDEYKEDNRFNILSIPYKQAQSACWARNKIQQEYNKERYTLQLDSHHRFAKDWDEKIITMYQKLRSKGVEKPLLTSYIPSYNPEKEPEGRVEKPWAMKFDRFTPEGVIFFLPYTPEPEELYEPIPARFYSAHFAFTTGLHAEEVQHDPSFYFHGEEITLAVRSFTHGYDLYHPNEVVAWHEYTRRGRTKQWDDDPTWVKKNNHTHTNVRKLLGVDGEKVDEESFGMYGLGKERTLSEYETYSGIRFTDRNLTQSCIDNKPPPGNPDEELLPVFSHILNINVDIFNKDDYKFAAIICEDKNKKELYRKDYPTWNDLIKQTELEIRIKANIRKPSNIVVWAYSESEGWSDRQDIPV